MIQQHKMGERVLMSKGSVPRELAAGTQLLLIPDLPISAEIRWEWKAEGAAAASAAGELSRQQCLQLTRTKACLKFCDVNAQDNVAYTF